MVVAGVCLAIVSVLVCIAAAQVFPKQAHRSEERSFFIASEGDDVLGFIRVGRLPFDDRVLLRVDVDPVDSRLDLPPGLERWPQKGEVILSSAARELVGQSSDFGDLVPGKISELSVEENGLRSPDELVAYRGVPREDLPSGGLGVANSGSLMLDTAPPSSGQIAGLTVLVALLVGFPSASFLIIAAKLSAAMRRQRLSVLYFLGASRKTIWQANAVEISVLAIAGWVAALLLYPVINVFFAKLNVLGTTWFPHDTSLTWISVLGTGVLVGYWVIWTNRRTRIEPGLTQAASRQAEHARGWTVWRFSPLTVGMTLLVVQVVIGASRPVDAIPVRVDLIMTGSILLTGIGLIVALPSMVHSVGRVLSQHGPSLAARIGGARAAFEPKANSNLVMSLALFVMIAGVTIGQTKDARAVSQPVDPYVAVSVAASELPKGAASLIRSSVRNPNFVLVSSEPEVQPRYVIAVGECHDMEEAVVSMASFDFPDCQNNAILVSKDFEDRATNALHTHQILSSLVDATSSRGVLSPRISEFLAQGGVDALVTLDGEPVLDAIDLGPKIDAGGTVTYSEDALLIMIVPREEVTHALATIYRFAPYSQPSAVGLDPDSGQNIARINGFIRLGLVLGSLMTLVALITATLDRVAARRSADQEMILTGAPCELICNAHRWEIVGTVVPGVGLALFSGLLGGLAWQYAGGLDRRPDWLAMAWLTALGIVVIALVTQIAANATKYPTKRARACLPIRA